MMKFPRPQGLSMDQNNALASPEARHGTPEEIMGQAKQARLMQQGGAWSPAVDALESFAYSSPVTQNQTFADEAGILSSPWQRYGAVLNARGAQLNTNADAAEPRLGAGVVTPPALKALQTVGMAPAAGGWSSFKGGTTLTPEEAARPRINAPISAEEVNRPRLGPRPYTPGSR